MKIGMFQSIDISRTGLESERKRLKLVADNIANRNTTRTENGGYYKPKALSSEYVKPEISKQENKNPLLTNSRGHLTLQKPAYNPNSYVAGGVKSEEYEMENPPLRIFNPEHPDAGEDGYVEYPDIDLAAEMGQAITAIRAYEANTGVIDAAKGMFKKALQI
ncbi:MAG: flagellar basal body rod protein FlgC [Candidatus Zixiibacteriota bacterium]